MYRQIFSGLGAVETTLLVWIGFGAIGSWLPILGRNDRARA